MHLWAEGPFEPLPPEIEKAFAKVHKRLTSMTPVEKEAWCEKLKKRLAEPDPEFEKRLAAFDAPVDWEKAMNAWLD